MIRLKDVEVINGCVYELLKRSDKVALYSVDGGRRYEVTRIYIYPKSYWGGYAYREREAISLDGLQFAKDGSRILFDHNQAIAYFHDLNNQVGGLVEEKISDTHNDRTGEWINDEAKEAPAINGEVNSTEQIVPLPHAFKKNGLTYQLIKRDGNIVMYSLFYNKQRVGFEVFPVRIESGHEDFGKIFHARESIPSNEEFGIDSSRAFFPHEYERAMRYYEHLCNKATK